MEQKIRSELLKMSAIMLVLMGLGIYAHEFVIAGIQAKVALNLSIFATFGLAAWLAFRHVLNLKNEVVALNALKVDYGMRSRRPLDPYRNPAIVFQEPELLGQGYRLITEELSKQDGLQISNATVQVLLHDVDQRINDRKSTIMYFSGLMVFLGLLGAFMGLMKTVHSVGDLIGSMDVSGTAGTDSFGKLIEGMKGPLNGMSVGFSSSLFGLMTSMVLGALERFMTSAMKTLRNEFEHWLSNLAALENAQSEGGGADVSGVVRALEVGGKQLKELRESVLTGSRTTQDTQLALTQMAQSVTQLSQSVQTVSDPTPLLQPIADVVAELARNQTLMVSQFHGLFDMAERDRATIHHMLETMNSGLARQASLDGSHLHTQLEKMVALQSDLLDQGSIMPTIIVEQIAAKQRPVSRFERILTALFGKRTTSALAKERKKLRAEVRALLLDQRKAARAMEKSLGTSISKVESGRKSDQDMVAQMMARNDMTQARLTVLLDRLQGIDAATAEATGKTGGDLDLLGGLHGARLEMEVLRNRMHLSQEAPADAADIATPKQDERRATGTDNG